MEGVIPRAVSTFVCFEIGVSLAKRLPSRSDWPASEPQRSARLYLPSAGITNVDHHAESFFSFLSLFFFSSF